MKYKKTILILVILSIIIIIGFLILNKNNQQPSGDLQKITYEEIVEKQKNKEDFILIVSRSTCSHCLTYKPKVKKIAQEYNIITYYIDLDQTTNEDEILNELNLSGATPITLFFEKGQEKSVLNRIEGDLASTTVINKFKKMGFIK